MSNSNERYILFQNNEITFLDHIPNVSILSLNVYLYISDQMPHWWKTKKSKFVRGAIWESVPVEDVPAEIRTAILLLI